MSIKVSVIIPCFNVEDYITECVQSCINQTYKNVEIICVDNNSSDNTWQMLLDLKCKYPHIILDKELKNGAPAARNKGLSRATGLWIQFLDADDLLLPNKIEHQVGYIYKTQLTLGYIAGAYIRRKFDGSESRYIPIDEMYLAPFINKSGNTCSNLWNAEAIKKINLWNIKLRSSQETDLMFRLIEGGFSYLVDEHPLTIIRDRESGQISQRNPSEKWKQYIMVRLDYIKYLKHSKYAEFSKVKNELYDFLMVSVITLARYDKAEALKVYKNEIQHNWKTNGNYGFSKLKFVVIKLFDLKLFLYVTSLK